MNHFKICKMWSERNVVFDNNICRFCGSVGKKLRRIQVRQSSIEGNEENSVWQLIRRFVPIKIDPQDQKPQQICLDCISTLEKYDSFISTSLANDIFFDNLLQSFNSKNYSGILWPQMKAENNQSNITFPQNINNSNVQNENLYIVLELNCKALNIESSVLKSNESAKNALPAVKTNVNDIQSVSEKNVTEELSFLKKNEKKIKAFKCNICSKSLSRKSNLVAHLALHSKNKPHKCTECGKDFILYADLNLHKHIHNQSYACKICKKCFVTKSKLERHCKSHTGVKDHPCPVCNKCFAEKNNMLAHMTVHSGERPFSCPVCKKSFRTQSHLRDHNKVHSLDSPFKCLLCNKSFKWKSNLKNHSKFHTGEKFKCSDCCKEFSTRRDYYKHRKDCRQAKAH